MDTYTPSSSIFRIDIKNKKQEANDCVITTDYSVNKPNWFKDSTGQGYVIQSEVGKGKISIKVIQDGELLLYFKGIDKRKANTRIPLWIDYISIKIDQEELLQTPVATWHDKPYKFSKPVKDGQIINVEFECTHHIYTEEELQNNILFYGELYLKENLPDIISSFYSTLNQSAEFNINSLNFWSAKAEIQKMTEDNKKAAASRYYKYLNTFGSWIGLNSSFASEPITPHGLFGIFVSEGAKIGRNCVIFQQVTIGSNTLSDSKNSGSPTIGDNCYIGAGAKIIGKVKIGNNVRVGANAVVVTDVPDNSVVVLNKPKIIHKENMDNKFYHNYNGQYGYHLDGKFFPVDTKK